MSPQEQLALGGQALGRAARELLRAGPWAAFALLGALEALVLLALALPAHPALSWAVAPLAERVMGERALHYPDGFRLLPSLFGPVDAVLAWLVGSLAMGAASHAFAARFRGAPVSAGASFGAALRRWPALAIALLPAHAVIAGLGWIAPLFSSSHGIGSTTALPVFAVAPGVVVLLGFYLPALVMIGGRGGPGALAALPRAWARGLVAGVVPCLVTLAPVAVVQAFANAPGAIVERGTPELVAALLGARIALSLVASVLLSGAATLGFLAVVEDRG